MAPRIRRAQQLGLGRLFYRLILVVFIGLIITGLAWSTHTGQMAAWATRIQEDVVAWSVGRGLVLVNVDVRGRAFTSTEQILGRAVLAAEMPMLALNPRQIQADLKTLPFVKQATVKRLWPDRVEIILYERHPAVLWYQNGKTSVIDRDGVVLPLGHKDPRVNGLITVTGPHSETVVPQALALVASNPQIASLITTLSWVGQRRWTVHLRNGSTILLPEGDGRAVWRSVTASPLWDGVISRAVHSLDLRLEDRAILRPLPDALPLIERPNYGPRAKGRSV